MYLDKPIALRSFRRCRPGVVSEAIEQPRLIVVEVRFEIGAECASQSAETLMVAQPAVLDTADVGYAHEYSSAGFEPRAVEIC